MHWIDTSALDNAMCTSESGVCLPAPPFIFSYHLVVLVVKASASRAEDPGFESRLRRDFVGVESYQ